MQTQKKDWYYWYDKFDVWLIMLLSMTWGFSQEPFGASYWMGYIVILLVFVALIPITAFIHACQVLGVSVFWGLRMLIWKPWAVVVADAGAIGAKRFWKMDSAQKWAVDNHDSYEHISPVMLKEEVTEYMEWIDDFLYPSGRELA